MSNKISEHPEHDEVFSMLPWYVNQSLEPSQRGSVSRHISQCEECQREVQFLTSLNESVQHEAEGVYRADADMQKSLASVMDRIDAEAAGSGSGVSWPSLLKEKLDNLFSFSQTLPNVQWAATALACVLVTVLGFQVFYNEPTTDSGDGYSVLSSPDIDNASMRLSVGFKSGMEPGQAHSVIAHEFEKFDQQVDIAIFADNVYTVNLKGPIGVPVLNSVIIALENDIRIERVSLLP